jgi:hypothetical protein
MNAIRTSARRSVLLACALAMTVSACSSNAPLGPTRTDADVVLGAAATAPFPADPAGLVAAAITGDTLRLTVQYAGGCAQHHFQLRMPEAFMESQPVQAHLRLGHDARGDSCKALLTEQLSFDLTSLRRAFLNAYAGESVLILHVIPPGNLPHALTVRYEF